MATEPEEESKSTIVNKYADDVPLTLMELSKAMRVSRWTVQRWKDDGYKFEFKRWTTMGHLKAWLRKHALEDKKSAEEKRMEEAHSRLK